MQCSTVQLDPKDARALYARGLAKRRNGYLTDGDADVAARQVARSRRWLSIPKAGITWTVDAKFAVPLVLK
jgi:hypothetical protein